MAMPLQLALSQSITQAMGIDDILAKTQYRAEQEGEIAAGEGAIGAAKALGSAAVDVARTRGETEKVKAGAQARSNLWGAALAGIGAVSGAAFLPGAVPGMTAIQGASLGSSIGSAVSGSQPLGQGISGALGTAAAFESTASKTKLSEDLTKAQTDYYKARSDKTVDETGKKTPADVKKDLDKISSQAYSGHIAKYQEYKDEIDQALESPRKYAKSSANIEATTGLARLKPGDQNLDSVSKYFKDDITKRMAEIAKDQRINQATRNKMVKDYRDLLKVF